MKMILTLLLPLLLHSTTWAQSFIGTFVAIKGDVKILRNPTNGGENGPLAIYEGVKYSYEIAKIGKKIRPQEIVQSGADGKAKITYPNGDQFVIGVGTTMVMPSITDKSEDQKSSSIQLLYGRLRALISKSGPRNNMKVKTPTAVAGVRGTDFFTRANPSVGTQLTVIRGEVAVNSIAKPEEVVQVKTGFSVEAKSKTEAPPQLIETTKEDLMNLQSESTVKVTKEQLAELSPEVKKTVNALSEKTKDAMLNDIKTENAALYNELKMKQNLDTEEINTAVVAKLYVKAPSAKKKQPSQEEIDAIGRDVYEKYFK
ncbi:MAG: hypothetical protein A2Z20_11855 [Bdellovibrionales bacterium RBG_16_40_8]|nr:MAG: hypothetical protein A2Z20_11855 [Bdellovibrionales bacterium RBG_16_40_8]